jgi:hypothetical protein
MSDETTTAINIGMPPYEDAGTAPFIYFDMAPAYGVLAGAFQIEFASRILIPLADGGVQGGL